MMIGRYGVVYTPVNLELLGDGDALLLPVLVRLHLQVILGRMKRPLLRVERGFGNPAPGPPPDGDRVTGIDPGNGAVHDGHLVPDPDITQSVRGAEHPLRDGTGG